MHYAIYLLIAVVMFPVSGLLVMVSTGSVIFQQSADLYRADILTTTRPYFGIHKHQDGSRRVYFVEGRLKDGSEVRVHRLHDIPESKADVERRYPVGSTHEVMVNPHISETEEYFNDEVMFREHYDSGLSADSRPFWISAAISFVILLASLRAGIKGMKKKMLRDLELEEKRARRRRPRRREASS